MTQIRPKVTWAEAARDVIISGMARGQLPMLAIIGLAGIVVARYPADKLPAMTEAIGKNLATTSYVGWALFLVVAAGWALHVRWLSRMHHREICRLAEERNRLQEAASPNIRGNAKRGR